MRPWQWIPIACVVALTTGARAQEPALAVPAPAAPAGLAELTWAQAADLQGVSLSVTAVGHAEAGKSALEAAVVESHRRLLALVSLEPSPEAFDLFEHDLIIGNERALDDGGVEVQVSISLAAFAGIVRQLRSGAPDTSTAPTASGTPLLPTLVLPVVVKPDGSAEIVGGASTPLPATGGEAPPLQPGTAPLSTMAALNARGLDLAAQGKLREAIVAFRQALETDPDSPLAAEPYVNLAAIYFHGNRLEDALEHYRKAAELNPTYPLARYGLGLTYRLVGQTPMAAMELMAFLQLEPTGSLAEAAKTILRQIGALPPPPTEEKGAITVPPVVPAPG